MPPELCDAAGEAQDLVAVARFQAVSDQARDAAELCDAAGEAQDLVAVARFQAVSDQP